MATVVLFWTNMPRPSQTCDDWQNSLLEFSPFHDLVFRSHEKAGNTVELWTYQRVEEFPYNNIRVCNAETLYPADYIYRSLNRGHSIAFVSDACRLKRASEIEGIVLDMDCVCLRPFPDGDSWFATMPSKKTGGFAPQWGKNKPPFTVHDGSWDGKELAIFPIKVGPHTRKPVKELADWIVHRMTGKPSGSSNEWNKILWTVKEIANKDTTATIYKPLSMCPLPAWLGKNSCYSMESPTRLTGDTVLFGHRLPSIQEIFDNSYCVAHFFESTFSNSTAVNPVLWQNLPPDCLLYKECEFVYGPDW